MIKSSKYGIDPFLVMAVIKAESNFDPNAISRVGAIGLMQLMPQTANYISKKLGYIDYQISDPAMNIEMGCWYIANLMETYKGDIESVLAAYNGGNYDKEILMKNTGVKLYVKKVERYWSAYKMLYTPLVSLKLLQR
jgi:soluble lytic murein transglycosylase